MSVGNLQNRILRKLIVFIVLVGLFLLLDKLSIKAYSDSLFTEKYYKAKIVDIKKDKIKEIDGYERKTNILKVMIIDGDEKGKELEIEYDFFSVEESNIIKKDKIIILAKTSSPEGESYYILDVYRLPALIFVWIWFFRGGLCGILLERLGGIWISITLPNPPCESRLPAKIHRYCV